MSILHAIKNASIDEVEAAGLHWRVRRICSADLAKAGVAFLAVASPDDNKEQSTEEVMNRISPKQAGEMATLQEATVCAGTIAVGDGEKWDDLRLVIEQKKEDVEKGVLWVGGLPAGVVDVLFARIMSLSTDGEEAAERLASFRKKSGDSSGTRGTGQDVWKATP
tara:strand:+ start:44 stop:538 length:495 start_codon:yes stop_codon:yes gene_type:complete